MTQRKFAEFLSGKGRGEMCQNGYNENVINVKVALCKSTFGRIFKYWTRPKKWRNYL